jgi:hypothetical protein
MAGTEALEAELSFRTNEASMRRLSCGMAFIVTFFTGHRRTPGEHSFDAFSF